MSGAPTPQAGKGKGVLRRSQATEPGRSADARNKDHRRLLTPIELLDIRIRENREGSPYSDRDMLLDHIELLEAEA